MSEEVGITFSCSACGAGDFAPSGSNKQGKRVFACKSCGRRQIAPDSREPKAECPFSAARLEELYWREGLSLAAIGRLAGEARADTGEEASGTIIGYYAVQKWLSGAGISVRSRSEARSLAFKTRPTDNLRKAQAVAAELRRQGQIETRVDHLHTDAMKTKAHRLHARAIKSRPPREKVRRFGQWPCEYRFCGNVVERYASENVGEHIYCCKRCAAKEMHLRRKENGLPPPNRSREKYR